MEPAPLTKEASSDEPTDAKPTETPTKDPEAQKPI